MKEGSGCIAAPECNRQPGLDLTRAPQTIAPQIERLSYQGPLTHNNISQLNTMAALRPGRR